MAGVTKVGLTVSPNMLGQVGKALSLPVSWAVQGISKDPKVDKWAKNIPEKVYEGVRGFFDQGYYDRGKRGDSFASELLAAASGKTLPPPHGDKREDWTTRISENTHKKMEVEKAWLRWSRVGTPKEREQHFNQYKLALNALTTAGDRQDQRWRDLMTNQGITTFSEHYVPGVMPKKASYYIPIEIYEDSISPSGYSAIWTQSRMTEEDEYLTSLDYREDVYAKDPTEGTPGTPTPAERTPETLDPEEYPYGTRNPQNIPFSEGAPETAGLLRDKSKNPPELITDSFQDDLGDELEDLLREQEGKSEKAPGTPTPTPVEGIPGTPTPAGGIPKIEDTLDPSKKDDLIINPDELTLEPGVDKTDYTPFVLARFKEQQQRPPFDLSLYPQYAQASGRTLIPPAKKYLTRAEYVGQAIKAYEGMIAQSGQPGKTIRSYKPEHSIPDQISDDLEFFNEEVNVARMLEDALANPGTHFSRVFDGHTRALHRQKKWAAQEHEAYKRQRKLLASRRATGGAAAKAYFEARRMENRRLDQYHQFSKDIRNNVPAWGLWHATAREAMLDIPDGGWIDDDGNVKAAKIIPLPPQDKASLVRPADGPNYREVRGTFLNRDGVHEETVFGRIKIRPTGEEGQSGPGGIGDIARKELQDNANLYDMMSEFNDLAQQTIGDTMRNNRGVYPFWDAMVDIIKYHRMTGWMQQSAEGVSYWDKIFQTQPVFKWLHRNPREKQLVQRGEIVLLHLRAMLQERTVSNTDAVRFMTAFGNLSNTEPELMLIKLQRNLQAQGAKHWVAMSGIGAGLSEEDRREMVRKYGVPQNPQFYFDVNYPERSARIWADPNQRAILKSVREQYAKKGGRGRPAVLWPMTSAQIAAEGGQWEWHGHALTKPEDPSRNPTEWAEKVTTDYAMDRDSAKLRDRALLAEQVEEMFGLDLDGNELPARSVQSAGNLREIFRW